MKDDDLALPLEQPYLLEKRLRAIEARLDKLEGREVLSDPRETRPR